MKANEQWTTNFIDHIIDSILSKLSKKGTTTISLVRKLSSQNHKKPL